MHCAVGLIDSNEPIYSTIFMPTNITMGHIISAAVFLILSF